MEFRVSCLSLLLGVLTPLFSSTYASAQLSVPFSVENFADLNAREYFIQGGIPLPRGQASGNARFTAHHLDGTAADAEVKVTAYWPDGSVKWVLVRMLADVAAETSSSFLLQVTEDTLATSKPIATQDEHTISVGTGAMRFTVARSEANLLAELSIRQGEAWVPVLTEKENAELIVEVEQRLEDGVELRHFSGNRDKTEFRAVLEEATPMLAVIRIDGIHTDADGETFAPYTLRLYAYQNDTRLRIHHTFVFDGQPRRDFIRGIGVRVRTTTGKATGFTFSGAQGPGYQSAYVEEPSLPAWRRGWLAQTAADSFTIRKVIDPASNGPIRVAAGTRAQGWGRLETTDALITATIKNFWQEYPKAIEVDAAERSLTAWFYAPQGEALDLRRYSDLGYHALYEAGAAGPGTPASPFDRDTYNATGISKSSDLLLDFAPLDSASDRSVSEAVLFQRPPLLRASAQWMAGSGVFGGFGAAPDGGEIRDRFNEVTSFYPEEQERNRWYSFIDYGDVMHSFDPRRNQWRYDEGGYAWLNNEGQNACSHWMAYLATGDERLYRFAEAMTRHVQDVDMYQTGPFASRGMRHNVNHWGGSNREKRMTIPQNKRVYYFLSGDEHTRDRIQFIYDNMPKGDGPVMYPTLDFGVGATALLFLWETTGDPQLGAALQRACETFGSNPIGGYGFPAQFNLDLATGEGQIPEGVPMLADYFLTFFGPLRILMETADLTDNAVIRDRVLTWSTLLLESEAVAKERQLHFAAGMPGAHAHLQAAVFAYRHTGDERYLDIVRTALSALAVQFERRGGDNSAEWPAYRALTEAHFQTNSNSITLYNYPYAFALLDELGRE